MMSDFDRENIERIVMGKGASDFSWFTARLLRAIAFANTYENSKAFELRYPEEYNAVQKWLFENCKKNIQSTMSEEEFSEEINSLFLKSDPRNSKNLLACFPKIILDESPAIPKIINSYDTPVTC